MSTDSFRTPPWRTRLVPGVLLPRGRFAWWYFALGAAVMAGGLTIAGWVHHRWAQGGSVLTHAGVLLYGLVFICTALLTPWLASGRVYAHDYPAPGGLIGWRMGVVALMTVTIQIAVTIFESTVQDARQASETVARSLGLGRGLWPDTAMVLAVTVLAPLGEEWLFRGLFFRSLRDGLARWMPLTLAACIGTALSSLLFALVHTGDGQMTQWPALFIMGMLLALTYEWTGSLLAPMLVHALNNMFALLGTLAVPGVQLSGSWVFFLVASAPVIVATVGTRLLHRLPRIALPPPLPAPGNRPVAERQSPGPAHPPDSSR
ncbi:MAG: lysostaphin resistance A-like protein [Brachymonas sp.]